MAWGGARIGRDFALSSWTSLGGEAIGGDVYVERRRFATVGPDNRATWNKPEPKENPATPAWLSEPLENRLRFTAEG